MSPPGREIITLPSCFPRVNGDEPTPTMTDTTEYAFSPRERG